MLVSFFFLVLSLTAISNAQAGNEELNYWWQRRGRYTVVSKVESDVHKIHHLLDRLKTHLRPALNDIRAVNRDGTPKISNAYATFFTDTVLVPQVDDILTKVTTGVSMLPGTDVQYSLDGSPVIMSVASHGDFRYVRDGEVLDAWDYYLASNKTETAVWLKESPYILLFPFFWEANPPQMNGDVPPPPVGNRPAWDCLIVDRSRNRFLGNDDPALGGINSMALIQWRTWVLMEELLYYYIHYTRGFAGQMLAANRLIAQPAFIKITSAQTYMYYAASIYGKCTDFPGLAAGRNILELDQPVPADFIQSDFGNATSVLLNE
ncbi:MAG: hypothetical protein LQ344_003748 [Seirophora lacunosa]|nr:MAG: hypothetical protein LQ344_003748 [Seirophora lacunosa]